MSNMVAAHESNMAKLSAAEAKIGLSAPSQTYLQAATPTPEAFPKAQTPILTNHQINRDVIADELASDIKNGQLVLSQDQNGVNAMINWFQALLDKKAVLMPSVAVGSSSSGAAPAGVPAKSPPPVPGKPGKRAPEHNEQEEGTGQAENKDPRTS